MDNIDIVMTIYNKLKGNLEDSGLIINSNKGASNLVILALAEAYQEGIEKGEISGRIKTVDEFMEVFDKMKN